MNEREKGYKKFFIIAEITVVLVLVFFIRDRIILGRSIQNIFDEMTVRDCKALISSENIDTSDDYYDPQQGIWMTYGYLDEYWNIGSTIHRYFHDVSGLSRHSALYISFGIRDEVGKMLGEISFCYYEKVNKLYIYGDGKEMSLADLETYRDYFLHEVIIGNYLKNGKSRFTEEDWGEIEVIDYLLPYEYCGMPEKKADKAETEQEGAVYIIWMDRDDLLCVQQKICHEGRMTSSIVYPNTFLGNIPVVLSEEVRGKDVGGSRFAVLLGGRECRLSDLIGINDGFIQWMKESGQAEGNLQRMAPDRETGYRNTQEMLRNCPEEKMQEVLESCEFYIEPGYLHIRFPYWDYRAKEPAFVKNGNGLWRGWLNLRTEDMERFLKVEKW